MEGFIFEIMTTLFIILLVVILGKDLQDQSRFLELKKEIKLLKDKL